MAKEKTVYVCSDCGGTSPKWLGKCPSCSAWNTLIEAGIIPFVPHTTLLIQLLHPREQNFWYDYDLYLLDRCDYLLRLPGESPGADIEVAYAHRHDIPVFEGTAEEFVAAYEKGIQRGDDE